eukprot:1437342-Amphidinium_carterae.1
MATVRAMLANGVAKLVSATFLLSCPKACQLIQQEIGEGHSTDAKSTHGQQAEQKKAVCSDDWADQSLLFSRQVATAHAATNKALVKKELQARVPSLAMLELLGTLGPISELTFCG